MRKIAEIRKDLNSKVAEVKALDRTKDAEALEKGLAEVDVLMKELAEANAIEAAEQELAERKFQQLQQKAGRSFSMVKLVREISEGRGLTGLEAEVAEMGAEEYRRLGLTAQGTVVPSAFLRASAGQNYTTPLDGGNLKDEMAKRYVDVLKEKLVIAQLGATVLTDLVGTLPVITSEQIQAGWGAEGAQAQTTKTAYAKATMTPHRNFIQTAVSKDLLRQTSFDVEADLLNKMTDAHANLIEAAAIAGTGADSQPKGILNTDGIGAVAMGTNGGAITWPKVVELETKVNSANANRGKLAYLTNAKVYGEMKTVLKAANSGRFIVDDMNPNVVNGYKADWSNLVPANLSKGTATEKCSAMIFGNFQDLYVGHWGGLDIVVDPYTRAAYGDVVLTLNAWDDVLVAQPKSFAAIKDIVTA